MASLPASNGDNMDALTPQFSEQTVQMKSCTQRENTRAHESERYAARQVARTEVVVHA
jgi:hypothetical protein